MERVPGTGKGGRRDPFSDPFFTEFFQNFDRELDRMRSMFNDVFQNAVKNAETMKGQPYVYGFTMRVGPDGRPQFQEFGNTKPFRPETLDGREPITDVIEAKDHVAVTLEIPGVDREDINLSATKDRLTVRVDTANRKYFKEVALPVRVKPETTEATYKNGVLDITIKRADGGSDEGHRVPIK